MTEHPTLSPRLKDALPFWISLTLIPVVMFAARAGGAWVWIVPVYAWFMTTLIDFVMGLNTVNPDPQSPPQNLFWYRLITLIWFPIQAAVIYGTIYYATHVADYGLVELLGLFFGVGVISGTIGIVYAHELLHQKNRVERWLGDLLLASVLYSHFRSEHLLVHHRYVGTPRDAVTARYNEGFHRFLPRVLIECIGSAWSAERDMLARKGHGAFHRSNPFWRYGALQLGMLVLAYSRGDAIIVAPTQYSQILWAAAYGALLFGEYPDRNTYIGTAIIILSGVYILKREATGKTSTQTPVLKTRSRTGVGSALRVGMILRRKKRQDDNK